MEESIRSLITEKSLEIREIGQVGPHRAAEILVELSSLLSSLNREIVESNYWYNLKKQELLKELGVVGKAKIHAEATQEWRDWQERKLQKEALEELIRSVKYYLRSAESELKEFTK